MKRGQQCGGASRSGRLSGRSRHHGQMARGPSHRAHSRRASLQSAVRHGLADSRRPNGRRVAWRWQGRSTSGPCAAIPEATCCGWSGPPSHSGEIDAASPWRPLGQELEHCCEPAFHVKRCVCRRRAPPSAPPPVDRGRTGARRALHRSFGTPTGSTRGRTGAKRALHRSSAPPPAHRRRVPDPSSTANTRRTKATRPQARAPPPSRHPHWFDAGQDGCQAGTPPLLRHPYRGNRGAGRVPDAPPR